MVISHDVVVTLHMIEDLLLETIGSVCKDLIELIENE